MRSVTQLGGSLATGASSSYKRGVTDKENKANSEANRSRQGARHEAEQVLEAARKLEEDNKALREQLNT